VHLALFSALLLQAAAQDTAALKGARNPSYAPDGRLAVAIDGDLYAQSAPNGRWVRVTTGAAWDRDPAWTRDGGAIVFASDRGGGPNLWRVRVNAGAADGAAGAAGEPERVTTGATRESAPTTAPDGSIAFVRGTGAAARIVVRATDGAERRLDTREQAQVAPSYSPDGSRIAYVLTAESGRRLTVRTLASGRETQPVTDRAPESVTWSPDNARVAFSTGGARPGIFVTPADGRYLNFVSASRGDIAWSPDGRTLAVAEHEDVAVGYNGDPDRLGDRVARESYSIKNPGALVLVSAPAAPDTEKREARVEAARDLTSRNADAFDRAWERSAAVYFSAPEAVDRRAQWEALRTRYRPAALATATEDDLERVIYRMLRERPPLRAPATGRAAVSSAHPVATAAGLEIFRAGGNVVDAAAAVSFALGVVEPDASGVGGYGQMVIALAKEPKPTLIEFMTRVPSEATLQNTSLLQNGRLPPDGPVLANVPGTVAGMYKAWKEHGSGKVAWKDIVAPAIRAARDGYVVSEGLATTLATEREHFQKYESSRKLFFRDGKPLAAGDTLRNPDLAWVLEQIAQKGADGFYKGEVAKKLVDDLRPKGNAMKMLDLASYFAVEREPVSGTYRAYTIYSSAPPVAGGADLVAKLNLLEHFTSPKLYTEDAATVHAAISAWTLVPGGRGARIADPSLWPVDLTPFTSKDTARVRWACYSADKALKPSDVRGDTLRCLKPAATGDRSSALSTLDFASTPDGPSTLDLSTLGCPEHPDAVYCHQSGTTAFAVADNDGNAVAVTQTLGTWGGNFYVSPGLGFLYNDKLGSYGTNPDDYGARLPFARHGSTLAPTVVFKNKKPVFAVGAAGNNWITSAVYETLLGALDYGLGPQQALELPRFQLGGGGGGGRGGGAGGAGGRGGGPGAAGGGSDVPGGPPPPERGYTIQVEDGFSPDVIKRLRELGYEVEFISLRGELREGYGAAVAINGKNVTAGADPRRAGAAGAVP
jgi:gamma-glutamyltranspeptidase